VDENRDGDIPLDVRPVHRMPGVSEVLPRIALPLALWANTRLAREYRVRTWLRRAGLDHGFRWVMTSFDAGARKPTPQFFEYVLGQCGLGREDVLFVGNQLNTDVAGGQAFGIPTVWLSAQTIDLVMPRQRTRFERFMILQSSYRDFNASRAPM
jgi:FMN phosphatase YigB (HAD superfamily)